VNLEGEDGVAMNDCGEVKNGSLGPGAVGWRSGWGDRSLRVRAETKERNSVDPKCESVISRDIERRLSGSGRDGKNQ